MAGILSLMKKGFAIVMQFIKDTNASRITMMRNIDFAVLKGCVGVLSEQNYHRYKILVKLTVLMIF